MSAVLIVMTWLQVGHMMTVSMQEFSSSDRCELARKAIVEQTEFWSSTGGKFQAFCVPK